MKKEENKKKGRGRKRRVERDMVEERMKIRAKRNRKRTAGQITALCV